MRRFQSGKRLWVILSVLLILQTSSLPAHAVAFGDVRDHWARIEIEAAADAGLIQGFPDGSYRPEESVTRAQFITILARVQGLTLKPGTGGFADLDGHWLAEQGLIQAAVDAKLVVPSDYGDTLKLQPDLPLTRVEVAVLAARATNRLGAALTLNQAPLPYVDQIPEWTQGYLAAMHSAGVLRGNADGRFGPGDLLTRAQAAAVATRSLRAARAQEVPVWEGNSWAVTTLPHAAHQVTASPDGTLYWQLYREIWRMAPGEEPTLFHTLADDLSDRAIAATNGAVYIADRHQIYRITLDGQMTPWAGSETFGYQNGIGSAARFHSIRGLCADHQGNLFVTEYEEEDLGRLRKVDPDGRVSLIAGLTPQMSVVLRQGPWPGNRNNLTSGVDGPGYLSNLYRPTACAADGEGNVFVVTPEETIRRIDSDGTVSWVAGSRVGSGTDGAVEEAGFGTITSLAVDRWGNLWLTDGVYDRVRRITPDGHVYTVAGSGGHIGIIRQLGTPMPSWFRDSQSVDGSGPEAVLGNLKSLAMAGGRIYVVDGSNKLRVITGKTDWYSADQSLVLQPKMDDRQFWSESGGRVRPETVRLPVALYAPSEAVGLKVDGQVVDRAHHPHYTLRWEAKPGIHQLIPLVRRPDGTWIEGSPRSIEVDDETTPTSHRAALLLPSGLSWLQGTTELRAISHWGQAEIRVNGQVLARGTGLISVLWDSTQVPDGIYLIEVAVADEMSPHALPVQREVRVANRGLPEQLPEVDG